MRHSLEIESCIAYKSFFWTVLESYNISETGTPGDRILGPHDTVAAVGGIMPEVIDLMEDLYLYVIEQ